MWLFGVFWYVLCMLFNLMFSCSNKGWECIDKEVKVKFNDLRLCTFWVLIEFKYVYVF